MTIDTRLAEIRARCDAATEGPWLYGDRWHVQGESHRERCCRPSVAQHRASVRPSWRSSRIPRAMHLCPDRRDETKLPGGQRSCCHPSRAAWREAQLNTAMLGVDLVEQVWRVRMDIWQP